MNIVEVKSKLNKLKSDKLKEFSSTITKSVHPMIGVSIPNLRSLAKEIVKGDYILFLELNSMDTYEEMLLQGFVVGYSKMNDNDKYKYLDEYIPRIADWSECDSVVSTLKFMSKDLDFAFDYLDKYYYSVNEFEKRFAIVCYLSYFLVDEYIDVVLDRLIECQSELYYVNMAVAWALSVAFVKYFDKTMAVFKDCNLDVFTYNKTIQKCKESFRLNNLQKDILQSLKK